MVRAQPYAGSRDQLGLSRTQLAALSPLPIAPGTLVELPSNPGELFIVRAALPYEGISAVPGTSAEYLQQMFAAGSLDLPAHYIPEACMVVSDTVSAHSTGSQLARAVGALAVTSEGCSQSTLSHRV